MDATDVAPSASPLKLLLHPSILIVMCDVGKDGDWTELGIAELMASTIWGGHIPSIILWTYANECRGDRSNATSNNHSTTIQQPFKPCSTTIQTHFARFIVHHHVWMWKKQSGLDRAFVCDRRLLDRMFVGPDVCWTGRPDRSPLHFG